MESVEHIKQGGDNMRLLNKAQENIDALVAQTASKGLLCLDACLCTDPEGCAENL